MFKWIVVLGALALIGFFAMLGYDAYRDHFAAVGAAAFIDGKAARNQVDAQAISQLVDSSLTYGYNCKAVEMTLAQCKAALMEQIKQ
jgi:hypothetical protein